MSVIYQKENQEIIIIKDRLISYLKVGDILMSTGHRSDCFIIIC